MKAYLLRGRVVFAPLPGSLALGDAEEVKPDYNSETHRLVVRSVSHFNGRALVEYEPVGLDPEPVTKRKAKIAVQAAKGRRLSANEVKDIVEALVEIIEP